MIKYLILLMLSLGLSGCVKEKPLQWREDIKFGQPAIVTEGFYKDAVVIVIERQVGQEQGADSYIPIAGFYVKIVLPIQGNGVTIWIPQAHLNPQEPLQTDSAPLLTPEQEEEVSND